MVYDVQRGLQDRREVFGEAVQEREHLQYRLIVHVGNAVLIPRGENPRHLTFRRALTELRRGSSELPDEGFRAVVHAGRHLRDHLTGFLVLRGAEHRDDALQGPVVEGALIFEFERADRVRDVLERILDRVRVRVHRVDAPLVARRMVFRKADAVDRRIAQVDVGTRHVDLGAKHHGAFRVLASAHLAEEPEALVRRTVAVGRIDAGLLQGAAVFAHFVRGLLVDVGVARLDEVFRKAVHVLKVGAREVEVLLFAVLPAEAQPLHAVQNAVDVLLVFLHRVRVVEAHVAVAAVVAGQTEIEADALRVTDVEVAVRFRREARADLRHVGRTLVLLLAVGGGMPAPVAGQVDAVGQIVFDQVSEKVGRRGLLGLRFRVVAHQ